MEIREATINDAEILERLFSVFYKPIPKWSKEAIISEIGNKEKTYYLVIEDNEILGAFSLKFADSGELGEVVVDKAFRGRGIGSKLLRFAEQLVKSKGLNRVWCHSLEIYGVRDFYLKNGWVEEDLVENFFDGHNCFIFSKNLEL